MIHANARLFVTLVFLLAGCTSPVAGRNDAGTCQPACRRGFTCVDGACVSVCNPPCPGGTLCTADSQCVPVAADGSVPDAHDDASASDVTDAGADVASACTSPAVPCAGVCTDLGSDVSNCGGCGVACPSPANASPRCDAGVCGFACAPLYMPSGGACVPRALGDSWRGTMEAPDRFGRMASFWTGSEMVIVMLRYDYPTPDIGLAYNPSRDAWRTLPATGAPSLRSNFSVAWTGRELIVWGGWDDTVGLLNDGGRYDPATDSWTPMSVSTATPSPRMDATAVWAGDRLVIWGGSSGATNLNTGSVYRPDTDTWTSVPIDPAATPPGRSRATAVWTGREVLFWGGCDRLNPFASSCLSDGARLDPVTFAWRPITTVGAPLPRGEYAAAWTGSELLVWGGGLYDVSTSAWSVENDGMRYDPSSDRWQTLAASPLTARRGVTGVWTGREFVVWGGAEASGNDAGDGARYDPIANAWAPMTNTLAPSARENHAAVWTGTEMLVAGGNGMGIGLVDAAAWRP